jgi:uncharacterized membrane protein YjgN (DUF898 family)
MGNGDQLPRAARAIDAYPLEFSGRGGEFFRVWIVNLLLTVVTIGFYTPFARRRTAQYFYSHTLVADSPLEFTAQQRRMVVGFVLLVALYLGFKIASQTGQHTVASAMALGAALLAPYFWASAMRFRLNATRWRGVRMQFTAGWGEVYRASWPVFVLAAVWVASGIAVGEVMPPPSAKGAPVKLTTDEAWHVLAIALVSTFLSLLCIARLEFNYKRLLVRRGRIGGQAGRWKPVFGDFVRIWLMTVLLFFACVLMVGVLLALAAGGWIATFRQLRHMGLFAILLVAALAFFSVFVLFLASAPARAYREARMFQLVWNNIGVSQVARFKSDLRARRYVGLRVRNIFLTLCTLGLFRPFAMVSEYRMKAESVTLHVKGGLDQLAGQLAREEEGLGDAIAGAVGLDLVG